MANNSEAQVRHVFDQWHKTIRDRDIDGLVALYAEDGIFESPAVLAFNGGADGILRGRNEIKSYFEVLFPPNWTRTSRNGSALATISPTARLSSGSIRVRRRAATRPTSWNPWTLRTG